MEIGAAAEKEQGLFDLDVFATSPTNGTVFAQFRTLFANTSMSKRKEEKRNEVKGGNALEIVMALKRMGHSGLVITCFMATCLARRSCKL
jgi:hypothetical protein